MTEQIAAALGRAPDLAPPIPVSIAETGISERNLLYLMLKFMHVEACETILDLADRMKLPRRVMQRLVEDAIQQRLIGATGASSDLALSTRYALTEAGRNAAKDALDQSLYLGPAPVSLAPIRSRSKSSASPTRCSTKSTLRKGFDGLVVPEHMFRRLLPAINAGRSVLLYGPPGNGKTTLSTRIAALFKDLVYIPYAVEMAGQIIKVFDAQIHKPVHQEPTRRSSRRPGSACTARPSTSAGSPARGRSSWPAAR